MFTGIVEERGEVVSVLLQGDSARMVIRAGLALQDAKLGDSISVNGVCLTVAELDDDSFTADVMAETLTRTSLGAASIGSPVNLERAMPAHGRLGGHLVQGHVDATGQILSITPAEHWTVVRVSLPEQLARYVAEKGSITVDGVSLTVVNVDDESFTVSLIPTTLRETTLGERQVGEPVNLEIDVIAKYVERLLEARK
ncbi:MAG: riboflavin synthase [Actinomycetota bacterium]|nr:riboflavin synthase [Actinomycetota bacterium]MDP2288435.1 riboflavin synthase [Actinomycetota bacterium]